MDENDEALFVQQHIGRRRVDLEGLGNPTIVVVGSGKDERGGPRFDEGLYVRSRIGESNGNNSQLGRFLVLRKVAQQRQLPLTDIAPGRPKHQ